jgi:DNA-binding LacI/PurR family transcriptional regulator
VAGVIMSPTRDTTDAWKTLFSAGIPAVMVDRSVLGSTLDSVLTDNSEAAYKLMNHLIKQGHKRIGGVFSDLGITTGRERFEGYKRALREAGLPLEETLVRTGLPMDDDGYRLTKTLLALPTPPTALFTGSKLLSYGALHAIYDLGLAIPADVALASFDELDWMPAMPVMSYAKQPAYDLGKIATELLLKRLETPSRAAQKVVLESTLHFDVRTRPKVATSLPIAAVAQPP